MQHYKNSVARLRTLSKHSKLQCAPMHNVMAALSNIGGSVCSTPQSLTDAHYYRECRAVTLRRSETVEISWGAQTSEPISAASWQKFTIL